MVIGVVLLEVLSSCFASASVRSTPFNLKSKSILMFVDEKKISAFFEQA
jgi:hypothetical protein